MAHDIKCRQALLLSSWVLTLLMTLALTLTINTLKEGQFEQKMSHSAECGISSCKFVDSVGCGCNHDQCDVCPIYYLGLTWLPGCSQIESNFTETRSWTFKPEDHFSCNVTTLKCYYSCPNIIQTLTLTQPYSSLKMPILGIVFETLFYVGANIVLIFVIWPFIIRDFYQEVP